MKHVIAVVAVAGLAAGCTSATNTKPDAPVAASPAFGEPADPPTEAGQAAAVGASAAAAARSDGIGPPQPGDFERLFPLKGTRAATGRNDRAEWRIYVSRKDDKTCVDFWIMNMDYTRGGGGSCSLAMPLDMSSSQGAWSRHFSGVTAPEAVKVRFEHTVGPPETINTVAVTGFAERFFVVEVSHAALTRVAALDVKGGVVAENVFDVG